MLDASAFNDLQPAVTLGCNDEHRQCGSHPAPRWRVIRSRPRAEEQAHRHLGEQGYLTYLPMLTLQVPDRLVPTMRNTVERPLFSSYLFVQLGDTDPTFPILSTYGVAQLVPGYARNGDVAALQAGDELRRHLPTPGAQWLPGTPCGLANASPLHGLPAVVVEADGNDIVIAVLFLGQLRRLPVHASQLVPRDSAG